MSVSPSASQNSQMERWVLVATILASSMAFIDVSALNIILPTLQTSLNATATDTYWVLNAYGLMLAALILIGGSLGDHYGRVRIFRYGVIVFTLASLACGFAPDAGFMIAARAVQGVGAALLTPGSLAIITAVFPPERRGAAIGTWSMFGTLTTVLGPVLGGLLADQGLWRGVFFINVPIALVVLYALRFTPESRDESAPPQLDYLGAVLATLGLGGVTYGFIELSERGLSDPFVLFALVGGVAALVAFVFVEARSPHPLMRLSLFRSPTFSGTNLLTLFVYGALSAFTFVGLYMQQVHGYSPSQAAYAQLPFAALLFAMSRWTGGMTARVGARPFLALGPLLVGVGMFAQSLIGLPAQVPPETGLLGMPAPYWTTFFPASLFIGVGMGLLVAPLTTAVMGAAPRESTGMASGINNAIARTAGVLALAIFGAVALILFSGTFSTQSAQLDLPEAARADLQAEAAEFGDAEAPASVPADQRDAVNGLFDAAFYEGYAWVLRIAAVMCWIGAAVGWLMTAPDAGKGERSAAPVAAEA